MNTKTISPFKAVMRAMTPTEQEEFARRIGSTRGYLYQLSNEHSTNRRPSAEMAIKIDEVSREMHRESKGRIPRVYRTDISVACRKCEFARKCLGDDIVTRSEFPVIGE